MSDLLETQQLYSELTGLPEPHSHAQVMKLTKRYKRTSINPVISIVMPIFNKESIIEDILLNLINSMSLPFELIIIDDASQDNTLQAVYRFLKKNRNLDFVLIENQFPIYETACDNVGITLSRGRFFLEVQSDIFIKDFGFDRRMITALSHGNLSSISGRMCHTWNMMLSLERRLLSCLFYSFKPEQLKKRNLSEGLVGPSVFNTVDKRILGKSYWISDTNNRGPWMVRMETFKNFGLLNSEKFFLGFDDHEFNFRCSLKGLKSGYTPMNIYTCQEDGSTRQLRSGINLEIYNELKSIKLGEFEIIDKISKLPSMTPIEVLVRKI